MDAYLRLIQQTQVESYNKDMQALYDILSGTVLDLYKVVSQRKEPTTMFNQCACHKYIYLMHKCINLTMLIIIYSSTAITYLLLKLHFSNSRRDYFEWLFYSAPTQYQILHRWMQPCQLHLGYHCLWNAECWLLFLIRGCRAKMLDHCQRSQTLSGCLHMSALILLHYPD